jgi:hypothetical protein
MEEISIEKLKNSRHFIENIRWDVTPKVFLNPKSASGEMTDLTHGYMLYVDLIDDKPVLVIMELRSIMSKTVGCVRNVPEDLLKESMQCPATECIGGMYPIPEKLVLWLKKEFALP